MTNHLYGATVACECGKSHDIRPYEVVYEKGAAKKLPALIAKFAKGRRVLVLMDRRTRAAAGELAAETLRSAGLDVQEITLADDPRWHSPICDDLTHVDLKRRVSRADAVVPVGSGVVNDLGKWIAADISVPFIPFATAASMNGYSSFNVAATVKGIKVLVQGRPAPAIAADPKILAAAPFEMTAAGLGDVLAKSASSSDWKLNNVLFGDYFCPRSVSLIAEIEPLYFDNPEGVRKLKADSMRTLFDALILTGVAMTMAGSSAPASGGEHYISHTLDMLSFVDGQHHDLHGRQVGIGTIISSELYRRLLLIENPEFSCADFSIDKKFWGILGPEVEKHYGLKVGNLAKVAGILSVRSKWDELRSSVKPLLRRPEKIKECLRRAGGAYLPEHIGCSKERLLGALLHAHEMRPRITILDLARMTGILPKAASEIIESLG